MSIRLETQLGNFWCWAAVAQSIEKFFNPSRARSQCQIVRLLVSGPCCTRPRPARCDVPNSLREILDKLNHLREFVEDRVDMDTVAGEVDSNLVLGARIEWPDGGGHFVIISGYAVADDGETQLEVLDPWDDPVEPIIVPYEEFAVRYRSIGVWTHSYLLES